METISITIGKKDVLTEVAKATEYTGAKMIGSEDGIYDRIMATDGNLADLVRFWDETVAAVNERFKEMLISGSTVTGTGTASYQAQLEVSKSFDKALTASVESTIRSAFIASIIGQWFKFANKSEASDYFEQAEEMLTGAERLLYSRRKPTRPTD